MAHFAATILHAAPAERVHGLHFRPDGALGCVSHTLVIGPDTLDHLPARVLHLDPGSGALRGLWELPPSQFAVPTPDGEALIYLPAIQPYSWDLEPALTRLSFRSGETEELFEPPVFHLFAAALAPGGETLAMLSASGRQRTLWTLDLREGAESEPEQVDATRLAWLPSGLGLALGGPGRVELRGREGAQHRWELPARVLAASEAGLAWAWEEQIHVATPGGPARALGAAKGPVTGLAWSPDGGCLLVGTASGTLELREVLTEAPTETLELGMGPLYSVAWAPDGRRVCAGGGGRILVARVDRL